MPVMGGSQLNSVFISDNLHEGDCGHFDSDHVVDEANVIIEI